MHALTTADFVIRLATGLGCGALIGVERQWRARMAGLRTNALVATGATLFVLYSEAVGDPGSPTRVASYVVSGKLTFALIAALAVLAVHLLLRPAGRLIDRAPQGEGDTSTRAAVHVTCDGGTEAHIRALLVQTLAATDLHLIGLRTRREADAVVLEAAVAIEGSAAAALEQFVSRLSLEPGIRDLHWHLTADLDPDEQAALV